MEVEMMIVRGVDSLAAAGMSAITLFVLVILPCAGGAPPARAEAVAGGSGEGALAYDRFEEPAVCADCHVRFTQQHEAAMMSQSYVHHWDEIEYFALALLHALKDEKVAGVKAGCNGCHAPLAYLAGDIPPPRPAERSRANEGVSCEVCHAITGFEGNIPFNFNWIIEPGEVKQGTRADLESDYHEIAVNPFLGTAEFCGTCHNEKDPFDQWVKATHLEWQESPQGKADIVCQDCHMPPATSSLVVDGDEYADARQHLFHGAHSPSKLQGAVEVRLYLDETEISREDPLVLETIVVNAKAGHMIPSGSAEERVVWLHVTATDAAGKVHHLPVDPKGFTGEEYTIAAEDALAYQDIGDIQDLADFAGLKRDGQVPAGDRIYRLPYLDPKGRMTVAQWNTASFGPDYRLPPLQAIRETFTWQPSADLPPGKLELTATVYYSRLVSSVADFLGVPAEEYAAVVMGRESTVVTVQ
jgi:hypothetical protein